MLIFIEKIWKNVHKTKKQLPLSMRPQVMFSLASYLYNVQIFSMSMYYCFFSTGYNNLCT